MENNSPAVSLVISVYNNISYLEMVLLSVARQSFQDFEVIIAEDNVVKMAKGKYLQFIQYKYQPDEAEHVRRMNIF